MAKEIIFLGAGAIGRGYLPWIFPTGTYDFIFVDSDPKIVQRMNEKRFATSFMAKNGILEKLTYPIKAAYLPRNFDFRNHSTPVAVFVQVGPSNCLESLKVVNKASCPIILCENDCNLVQEARDFFQKSNIFFGIPDVITSNTAPLKYLSQDPLSVITEDGVLFVDEEAKSASLEGDIQFVSNNELMEKQWKAKLYIHNTPHCIAAYLGALLGKKFVHEALDVPDVNHIVEGVMQEMLNSLKLNWDIPHDFLDWYAAKELSRFRNKLLNDPISRVAREPLRKLELDGRLIGAANICLSQGFIPENILLGIVAAFFFTGENESDKNLTFMRDAVGLSKILTHIIGLRKGEALEMVLSRRFEAIHSKLNALVEKYFSVRERTHALD